MHVCSSKCMPAHPDRRHRLSKLLSLSFLSLLKAKKTPQHASTSTVGGEGRVCDLYSYLVFVILSSSVFQCDPLYLVFVFLSLFFAFFVFAATILVGGLERAESQMMGAWPSLLGQFRAIIIISSLPIIGLWSRTQLKFGLHLSSRRTFQV